MNKVYLIGRLTQNPAVTLSQKSNTCVARYTLAVNRRFTSDSAEQTADFINCVAFGKSAEFVDKYLRKGMKMAILGRLQTGSYTDKDGIKRYTTDVVVEEHEFAEGRLANEEGSDYNGYKANDKRNYRGRI